VRVPDYFALAVLAGIAVVIVILLVADWLRNAWWINVLRNNLSAKRGLRRKGRSVPPADGGPDDCC